MAAASSEKEVSGGGCRGSLVTAATGQVSLSNWGSSMLETHAMSKIWLSYLTYSALHGGVVATLHKSIDIFL